MDVGGAALDGLLDHPVHELDDRRVLAAGAEVDRRVLAHVVQRARPARLRRGCGGSASASSSVLAARSRRGRSSGPRGAPAAVDVRRRGDRRADLVARHDRDVVDREDVGGVDHRDQQRAVAREGDRHGLVAAHGGGRDELGGVGIDAVELEVDVVEAEALGDGAGELVLGQRAVGDEHALGRPSRSRWRGSIARSIVPWSTNPRSTMTSVSTRPEPPRREGVVIPLPALWGPGRGCEGGGHVGDVCDGLPHRLIGSRPAGPAFE